MRVAVMAGAGLLLLAGAVVATRPYAAPTVAGSDGASGGALDTLLDGAETAVDQVISLIMGNSAMRNLSPALLDAPNMRAFLMVIRTGEGTADAGGYSRLYGGGQFAGFADHPRQRIKAGAWTSSAAGAYQALESTWDETARIMGLPDFSPASQDMFALGRIAYRGALGEVVAGNFGAAIARCAREWASLPGSPYGQPTISLARASDVYIKNGGYFA